MRTFSSYGPVSTRSNYYVPRRALVEFACRQLLNDSLEEGGHYITVWAPRQRGKTWVMRQVRQEIEQDGRFDVVSLSVQSFKNLTEVEQVLPVMSQKIQTALSLPSADTDDLIAFETLFSPQTLNKPLILIIDEFDSLQSKVITDLAAVFRNIYLQRRDEGCLLHGLALIGVRAVLGVENVSGSPFNVQRSLHIVQRSLHIPNLTYEEVDSMFHWYERESGQSVDQAVIDRVFYETQGQPGLTSWLGELLTETYNSETDQPITMKQFDYMYLRAINALPNNNIINIISKAKQEPYRDVILNLFKTDHVQQFTYDDSLINFLYMNGVVDMAETDEALHLKFPCPFVQKRLFNFFAREMFKTGSRLYDPFDDLSDTITERVIIIPKLLERYEAYWKKNRHWLLKNAPRRKDDLRIYEAVYHFNFYLFMAQFLQSYSVRVTPEFPTGNGKIDILLDYQGQRYGLEIKSFANHREYQKGLRQAARYGKSLGLSEIWLVLFVEAIDEANRQRFEATFTDSSTGVQVHPQFVQLGIDEQTLS